MADSRLDDRKTFQAGNVAKPLVGAHEVVQRGFLMKVQGDSKLKCVEGTDLTGEAVASDEVLSPFIVGVEEANDAVPLAGHIGRKMAP